MSLQDTTVQIIKKSYAEINYLNAKALCMKMKHKKMSNILPHFSQPGTEKIITGNPFLLLLCEIKALCHLKYQENWLPNTIRYNDQKHSGPGNLLLKKVMILADASSAIILNSNACRTEPPCPTDLILAMK